MRLTDNERPSSNIETARPVETSDQAAHLEISDRLHPSLREDFVPLPPTGIALTPEQLEAVFGGDPRGLHAIAKLAYQSDKNAAK